MNAELFARVVDRFSERVWQLENERKPNKFSVFHATDHVVLRFVEDHHELGSAYDLPLWSIVARELEPELLRIVSPYRLRKPMFSRAMFARLRPRSMIDRHVDGGRGDRFSHKIHVPIHTQPSIQFQIADDFFHLAVGRAYEVNNCRAHGAINPTSTARIHFIFEVFEGL